MAYKEWVALEVKATDYPLSVQNANLSWGKFYQYPNKDAEISAAQVNQLGIAPGQSVIIAACGRSGAASGTTGSLEIHHGTDGRRLTTVEWNCPWWWGRTSLYVKDGCCEVSGSRLEWCAGEINVTGVHYTSINNEGALQDVKLTYYTPIAPWPFWLRAEGPAARLEPAAPVENH